MVARKCSRCGKDLDFFDLQQDFTIHKQIKYGSVYDGGHVHYQLCCACFDQAVSECAVSPIEEECPFDYDTIEFSNGECFLVSSGPGYKAQIVFEDERNNDLIRELFNKLQKEEEGKTVFQFKRGDLS